MKVHRGIAPKLDQLSVSENGVKLWIGTHRNKLCIVINDDKGRHDNMITFDQLVAALKTIPES